MTLVYDHTMLAEPNLLIPGKKPIGPVKLDTTNSLARGLKSCLMFGGNQGLNAFDLITGTNRLNSTTNLTAGIDSVDPHIQFDSDSNCNSYTFGTEFSSFGKITLGAKVRLPPDVGPFHKCAEFQSLDPAFMLHCNPDREIGFYDGGYVVSNFQADDNLGVVVTILWCIDFDNNQWQVFVNGNDEGSGSYTFVISTTDVFDFGSDGLSKPYSAYDFFVWDRFLTLADAQAMERDRYQMWDAV